MLKDHLRRLWTGRQTAAIAAEVAGRCRPYVSERIQGRAAAMDLAEARGYIRARAAAAVQDETDYLLAKLSSRLLRRSEIASAALESLVEKTIAELAAARRRKPALRKAA